MQKPIDITALNGNFIKDIAFDFMLLAAGNGASFNMMTANWGGVGYIWNKPALFCVVRPERYTFEFMEKSEFFTASILKDEFKAAHRICGTKSGRDADKVKETGLEAEFTKLGSPVFFRQARLTLECRKMYADFLREDAFIDKSLFPKWYGAKGNLHKMFIAEIVNAWADV